MCMKNNDTRPAPVEIAVGEPTALRQIGIGMTHGTKVHRLVSRMTCDGLRWLPLCAVNSQLYGDCDAAVYGPVTCARCLNSAKKR